MNRRPIIFVWDQFGPYHADRIEAVAKALAGRAEVIGCQIARRSRAYAWDPVAEPTAWRCITLYEDLAVEDTRWTGRLGRMLRTLPQGGDIFLAGYQRPDIFLATLALRLMGRRVYMMNDSKFDDKPRNVVRELFKALACLPYTGALVGGLRHVAYLRFLGFRKRPIATGYDTLSLERSAQGGGPAAPEGPAFADRVFVSISRFVAKKNLPVLVRAYALYAAERGSARRRLLLVGSGPMEAELKALAQALGVADTVEFPGFLQARAVAATLTRALALFLPSQEEQWGLVINEALAFNLPLVVSENVGAREDLVHIGRNGFFLDADNAEGLAVIMLQLDTDEALWRHLVEGARLVRPRADVQTFVKAVETLTHA